MEEVIKREIITPERTERYELKFKFDGKDYSTIFSIGNNLFTNGCITIKVDNSDPFVLDTHITSNSPTKNCFSPPLLKDNLPPGVTQTDILQVLMTKLRFIILNPIEEVTLINGARLINPTVRIVDTYTTRFSLWKLFRKELTIYEKYGYTSKDYDNFRKKISDINWGDIKDYTVVKRHLTWKNNTEQRISLDGIFQTFYSDILVDGLPIDDRTPITDIVKAIPYEHTERSLTRLAPYNDYVTIIDIMADAIREKYTFENGTPMDIGLEPILILSKESELWKSWDSRLVFESFKKVGMPGGYRRSQRRRVYRRNRQYRQTRKKLIKLKQAMRP